MPDRDNVMFVIPPGTDIPPGEHPGYIDWEDEVSRANPMTKMTRAVLRLSPSGHSAQHRDIDITQMVLSGKVKFNFLMENSRDDDLLMKAFVDAFERRNRASKRWRQIKYVIGLLFVLGLAFWYWSTR